MNNLSLKSLADGNHFKYTSPSSLSETGLSRAFLEKLMVKHLYEKGILDIAMLSSVISLPGSLCQDLLNGLKVKALVETHAEDLNNSGLRYSLSEKGKNLALDALAVSGYVGHAPITLEHYKQLIAMQSVHATVVTKEMMLQAFDGVVIKETILDQLGPALHSGKAIFIYGAPGAGKTFVCLKLAALISGDIYIPYAIAVDEKIVQLFDPQIHQQVDVHPEEKSLQLLLKHDRRLVLCKRPLVVVGSELTMDDIEIQFDVQRREYYAPQQLKANNGMYLIDDLGRQQVSTRKLLNRWIIPMEEKLDYHNLGSGQHFSVPFDLVLMFSTNMNPAGLADQAFLRRIGHKIRFQYLDDVEYREIWQQVCEQKNIKFQSELVTFAIKHLHEQNNVPMLPCHPRDILSLSIDRNKYYGGDRNLSEDDLKWAWNNYFVNTDIDHESAH